MGVNSLEGVGVTDDSLELSELETMTEGSVRDSKEPMGEGPGIDSVTDNSVLDGGTVEGLDTGLPSTSSGNSLEGNDGLYVDDGNGISSGRRSSYWYASSSSPSAHIPPHPDEEAPMLNPGESFQPTASGRRASR